MARTATLIKYLFLGFVILAGGIVSTADATDWFVPGPGPMTFPTIQVAIDSVAAGDTITVIGDPMNPTVYMEYDIDFKGKNVTLQTGDTLGDSNSTPWTCIINCQNNGRAFIFKSGETSLARLDGFIIINGYAEDPSWPQDPSVDASGYGGAIYCKNSSPFITNCLITDCTADAGGGAIFCDVGGDAYITFCDIGLDYLSYNVAGAGFYKYIDINDINDVNQLDVNDLHQLGGGIYCRQSSPKIINCMIAWNEAAGSGGGIACEESNALIRDCDIYENECWVKDKTNRIDQHGGGIYCKGGSPTIERGFIIWNFARWSGGGIAVQDGDGVLIDGCDIIDNISGASAGGIYSQGNPSGDPNADPNNPNCIIQNCVIAKNKGSWSGGVSSNYGSFADIDNCTIAWNIADYPWLVGGLECDGGDANVANSIITDNSGVQTATAGGSALALGVAGLEMASFGGNASIDVSYSNVQMFANGFIDPDPNHVWPGEGNINKDPLFVDLRRWDFHLKAGGWNTSPCINAGDPFADYSEEPAPNGGRINIGAYGGTEEASSSDILRPVPSDADGDLAVNMVDFAILADNWHLEGANIKNKKADFDNNDIVDERDLSILYKFWLWLQ